IEAGACGAPVIAFNRGSIPEIVKTGVTGFVVEDVEGMVDAIQNLDVIDRAACRAHVLEQFSVERMADGYEAVYRKLLGEDAA
ncbi:MAG TPA: glycosyltransferase, partial [Candidatus Paceibacterota bacterium]